MSALHPIAVYGLTVPAGDVMVPALTDLQATVCFLLLVQCLGADFVST